MCPRSRTRSLSNGLGIDILANHLASAWFHKVALGTFSYVSLVCWRARLGPIVQMRTEERQVGRSETV